MTGNVNAKIPDRLRAPLPKRGNKVSRWFGRVGMRLLGGWRIEGTLPATRKAIIPVAPHTSNWDFFVGVFVMLALGVRLSFFGKHTLFRFPINGIMRWLGGIPVDRRKPQGVVEQSIEAFDQRDELILALAPEGTRRKVAEWKKGFLHIAKATGVPVIPVSFDFSKKTVNIAEPMIISGDIDDELARVKAAVSHAEGKHPENA
ncbi:lysophospholipid acyltransferase family protein [Pseudidiomarina sp.]|uniref:lysophospholipid acyltransferase family protein n=1 Tax=Pseudidiomarina sp. TaxID=2081707 RepID=UPI00299D5C15|nr:lysophospholipid acyltransferase family protein [Pseudidiomarina sp.]MDX1705604.1 lysophospholipid acyltransferase family protein [Pseudidiomarina sp.]